VKILCKEDVHICHTNFAKRMNRNSHETTSQSKTYGNRLFFEDLEVRVDIPHIVILKNLNFVKFKSLTLMGVEVY
jgi:hypothetical protein